MLTNIITNSIDTPRGTINPDYGISLRSPLFKVFVSMVFLVGENKCRMALSVLISTEFIQTTHQASLKILAKTLLDEPLGRLGTNATTSADNAFLAQVTL